MYEKGYLCSSSLSDTNHILISLRFVFQVLKLTLHITLFFFLCCMGLSAQAQAGKHAPRLVDARIEMIGTEISAGLVSINYKLPYSGMVEIRLFNSKGVQIWQNQYDHNVGENKILLKAGKFEPGESYAYVLNYKRDEVREILVISPGQLN
jgi:hypothetical protein